MNLISVIFTVLTVIAGGVSIMLVVSTKTLRDSRDDQEKRIVFLEGERTRDQEKIRGLETAVTFWRSAARGDEKLDGISKLLNQHHQDAVVNWVQLNTALLHVGGVLDSVDAHMLELVSASSKGDTP